MNQPPLDFVRTHTRPENPSTSAAAAASQVPKLTASMERVFSYLEQHPVGRTDDEGRRDLGMYSYRRRRSDLKNAGLVEACGERPGPTGASMTVWRLKR